MPTYANLGRLATLYDVGDVKDLFNHSREATYAVPELVPIGATLNFVPVYSPVRFEALLNKHVSNIAGTLSGIWITNLVSSQRLG